MRSASRACSARSSAPTACARACPPSSISRETEQTRESFDPNVQLVRSEQTSEDTRRGDGVQGVPGALSNQPPEIVAQPPARRARGRARRRPSAALALADAQLRARQDRQPHAPGGRRRSRACRSACSSTTNRPRRATAQSTPLTEQELASLTDIVRQAVGFDEARGDTISVVNSAFQPAPRCGAGTPRRLLREPAALEHRAPSARRRARARARVLRAPADDAGADAAAARSRPAPRGGRVRGADASVSMPGGRADGAADGLRRSNGRRAQRRGTGSAASGTSRSQLGGRRQWLKQRKSKAPNVPQSC